MAAPSDTESVKKFDKVGGLFKMGVSSDTWQERIFALSKKKKTLYYFRNDDEFKQYVQYQLPSYCAGVIPLFNTSIYVAPYMGPTRQFAFELVTLERNYVMAAPSEEELTEWVLTIASTGVKLKTPNKPTKDTQDMPYRRELGRQDFLHKKGDWNPSFRKRFFRTTENAAGNKVMSYYLKLEDAKPRGVITLTGSEIKALETPTTDFTIKDPTRREFVLRAQNELDRANWIDVLQSLADGSADTMFKVPNSMKRTTFYTTLDVEPDASQEDIARKYRALSKKHHPDRNNSSDAKETFQQLNEAYSVIGDPKRRAEYDNELIAAGILPADFVRAVPKSPSSSGPRLALEAAKDEDTAAEEDAARRNSEQFRAGHELKSHESNASDTTSPKGHKPLAHQVVVGDTQLATEAFLSNPDNFCSHCENKLKALYCCNCEIDFCISCSVQLHQEGVLALHKRLAINKVEDWMQAVQSVGSKEEIEWLKIQEDIKAYLAKNGQQRPSVAEEAVNQAKEKAAVRKSMLGRPHTLPPVSESSAPAPSAAVPAAAAAKVAAPAPAPAAATPVVIIPADPPKSEPATSPASEAKSKEDEEKEKKKKKKDKKEKKKKEEEEAAKKASEEAKAAETVDESRLKSVLSALEVGTSLYKIPRTGDAKLTKVYLKPMGNAYELAWDSHKWIGDSSIPLAGARLVQGQTTPLFKEQKHREQFASQAHLSFSVINDKRSVDLVALNEKEYNQWMQGIQYGIKPRLS